MLRSLVYRVELARLFVPTQGIEQHGTVQQSSHGHRHMRWVEVRDKDTSTRASFMGLAYDTGTGLWMRVLIHMVIPYRIDRRRLKRLGRPIMIHQHDMHAAMHGGYIIQTAHRIHINTALLEVRNILPAQAQVTSTRLNHRDPLVLHVKVRVGNGTCHAVQIRGLIAYNLSLIHI